MLVTPCLRVGPLPNGALKILGYVNRALTFWMSQKSPNRWKLLHAMGYGAGEPRYPCRNRDNFRSVFAGPAVGIKEILETRLLEPLENPFGPKLLPMS